MADRGVDKRELRPSTRLNPEDVRRERALSSKRSLSGHLSSLTKAQKEVEALLRDKPPSCVTLVRETFDQYEAQWKNFVLQHVKYVELADAEEQGKISERFNVLAQQRINLAATVEEFICKMAAELNERVMQDLQGVTKSSHRGSAGSCGRRSLSSFSSSKTQVLGLEAEKARLTLVFAEQEKQRKVEAEMKRVELERKQRELVRRREVEEEELKDIIRLESLKTEADNKLAEARKMAAIMDLEAKLAEDMELGLSDNVTTSMELTPLSHALPSPSINPPLTTVTTPTLSSTPKLNVSPAHTPGICASSSVTSLGLEPPVMSSFSPRTPPYPSLPLCASQFQNRPSPPPGI